MKTGPEVGPVLNSFTHLGSLLIPASDQAGPCPASHIHPRFSYLTPKMHQLIPLLFHLPHSALNKSISIMNYIKTLNFSPHPHAHSYPYKSTISFLFFLPFYTSLISWWREKFWAWQEGNSMHGRNVGAKSKSSKM